MFLKMLEMTEVKEERKKLSLIFPVIMVSTFL